MSFSTRISRRLVGCIALGLTALAVTVPLASASGPPYAAKELAQLKRLSYTPLYTAEELAQLRRLNYTPFYTAEELVQLRRLAYTRVQTPEELAELRRADYIAHTTKAVDVEAPASDAGFDRRVGVAAGLGALAAVVLAAGLYALRRRHMLLGA
jgi:hypothetical protein